MLAFSDGKKTLFWAIDLKAGLTDNISHINFMNILNKFTAKNIEDESNYYFTLNNFISQRISYQRMKDMVNVFRTEQLIYDLNKNTGIIFSIPDVIQCGMIGIMGVSKKYFDLIQLLEESVLTFNALLSSCQKTIETEQWYDDIEAMELISRLKLLIKSKVKQLSTI